MAEREMKRENKTGAWRRARLEPVERNARAAIGWSSCTTLNVCRVHHCSALAPHQHALQPAAGAPISHALAETSMPGCLTRMIGALTPRQQLGNAPVHRLSSWFLMSASTFSSESNKQRYCTIYSRNCNQWKR